MRTLVFEAGRPGIVKRWGCLLLALGVLQAAPPLSQKTFATPEAAARALVEASATDDVKALLQLFGPEGRDIVRSGDENQDRAERGEVARQAQGRLRIAPQGTDRANILIGIDEWQYPVPLVNSEGQWRFDSERGRTRVLDRRISANEVSAMDVCRGYVTAQEEYAAHKRNDDGLGVYAQKIGGTLYKDTGSPGMAPTPFSQAAAAILAAGKRAPVYRGYTFVVLKGQGPDAAGGAADYVVKGEMTGGFALLAFPVGYGVSGKRSFMVNKQAIVFAKDLGTDTVKIAQKMTVFNPDAGWKPANEY